MQVFSQLQSDVKLFQQMITVFGTFSSTTLSIAQCLPKSIVKISETKKDYSACHIDNKLPFYLKKEVKMHFKHEFVYIKFIFFPFKFHIAKMHIFAILVQQIPVCFDKKN